MTFTASLGKFQVSFPVRIFSQFRYHLVLDKSADGGYAGKLVQWVKRYCRPWELEIVKRTDDMKGFKLIPHRWVVERTFGWFGRYRRLSKDYEYSTDTSENMIYLAMIHLMLRRLSKV